MLIIPQSQDELILPIKDLWDGSACPDDRLFAQVGLSVNKEGLLVRVEAPMLHEQRIPDAPTGTRVEGLWEYDVVEVFLVGPGHQYLEIELGAGGHFLVLGFDSIRHREHAYEKFAPILRYEKTGEKMWRSSLVIPWKMIPENLRGLNTFAIMSGQFLAFAPVSGKEADFHQPDKYPQATIS
ncbi:hypothetical protein HQ487_04545 [Candidatus Uhrbacteria bacterium]|nr:hypothetical protein [Candidatus Uhrbacteria bacterium]